MREFLALAAFFTLMICGTAVTGTAAQKDPDDQVSASQISLLPVSVSRT